MADTRRTVLYLDPDAFALLADLAPSDKRRGKYVSELIRQAAHQQPVTTAAQEQQRVVELTSLHDQMLRLVGDLATVTERIHRLEEGTP